MNGVRIPALRNQAWVSLGVLLLGLCAAWVLSRWIAAGSTKFLIYAAVGLGVGAIALLILRNWRSGFYIFIVWLLFEDLIRKYLGNNMIIYFAKDALAAITYFSFFAAARKGRVPIGRFPFLFSLSLFFWLGVLQCFNPGSPSPLYSFLGLKVYFYYIPLMFVGYALIRTEEDLGRFLVINLGLAGAIALIGITQAIVGPSFLNPRVLAPDIRALGHLYRYAPVTGQIVYQPDSVFVSAGRFDFYLLLAWLVGLGAVAFFLLQHRRRGQMVVFISVALVAVAAVMSGGRGALLYVAGSGLILPAAFLWGVSWRRGLEKRLVKAIWRAAAMVGAGLIIIVSFFPEAFGARWNYYWETISPSRPTEQLTARVGSYPIEEFKKAFTQGGWVLGHGIGTTSLGVQYVSQFLGQARPAFGVESGFGNLMLEFGILGLFLWFVWTGALLIAAGKVALRLRQSAYFPLAFAIFWLAFLVLIPTVYGTLNGYQDYIYNAYLWLLVGILYRLPALAETSSPLTLSAHGR